MLLEYPRNGIADANIFRLNRRCFSCVIVAAAWNLQNRTNTTNAMAGALLDSYDHRSELLRASRLRLAALR